MRSLTRRVFSWFGLLAFVGSMGLPWVSADHLRWDDDLDCGSAILAVGHQTTGFHTPVPTPVASHCPLCHWQQALSTVIVPQIAAALPGFASIELQPSFRLLWSEQSLPIDRPSRAPPSVS